MFVRQGFARWGRPKHSIREDAFNREKEQERMRIRHLRYFLIVAEEQSFARAATRVHIEASPLSRAIKELENQLGVELLQRTKVRIQLTWPGEVFREEARRIVAYFENAQTRVHSASKGYHDLRKHAQRYQCFRLHLHRVTDCRAHVW